MGFWGKGLGSRLSDLWAVYLLAAKVTLRIKRVKEAFSFQLVEWVTRCIIIYRTTGMKIDSAVCLLVKNIRNCALLLHAKRIILFGIFRY